MFRSFVASCGLWCRLFDFFPLSTTWARTVNDETGETDPGDSRIDTGTMCIPGWNAMVSGGKNERWCSQSTRLREVLA